MPSKRINSWIISINPRDKSKQVIFRFVSFERNAKTENLFSLFFSSMWLIGQSKLRLKWRCKKLINCWREKKKLKFCPTHTENHQFNDTFVLSQIGSAHCVDKMNNETNAGKIKEVNAKNRQKKNIDKANSFQTLWNCFQFYFEKYATNQCIDGTHIVRHFIQTEMKRFNITLIQFLN